jgi:hypothetical protein
MAWLALVHGAYLGTGLTGGKTIDPITQLIMESLVRFGLKQLLDRFAGGSGREVPDLTDGGLPGEIRASFKAMADLRASLVMVGLQRGDSWHISVPVKYGEPLRLRVQRGLYQVTAWFFADADAPAGTPLLVAIAHGEIAVTSDRVQKFVLTGHNPLPAQLAEIRSAAPPADMPFWLPDEGPRMLAAGPGERMVVHVPELEIVSSPSCTYVNASGRRCAGPPEKGGNFCTRHTGEAEDGKGRIEILAWVGSKQPSSAQRAINSAAAADGEP